MGLEESIAIVQQGLTGDHPRTAGGGLEDNRDQSLAIANSRCEKTIAGRLGPARLYAIDADILGQQSIPIGLRNPVVGVLGDGIPLVKFGELPDDGRRHYCEIPCRRIVIVVWQSRAIGIVRPGHPEFGPIGIHQRREGLLAACDMLGKRNAGIVARLYDHAHQQGFHADLGVGFQKHSGGAHALAPGVFADRNLILQIDVTRGQFSENHVTGHYLGDARRFHPLFRLSCRKVAPALVVDKQIRFGFYRWRCRQWRDSGRGRQGAQGCEQGGCEDFCGHWFPVIRCGEMAVAGGYFIRLLNYSIAR